MKLIKIKHENASGFCDYSVKNQCRSKRFRLKEGLQGVIQSPESLKKAFFGVVLPEIP